MIRDIRFHSQKSFEFIKYEKGTWTSMDEETQFCAGHTRTTKGACSGDRKSSEF